MTSPTSLVIARPPRPTCSRKASTALVRAETVHELLEDPRQLSAIAFRRHRDDLCPPSLTQHPGTRRIVDDAQYGFCNRLRRPRIKQQGGSRRLLGDRQHV